VYPSFEKKERKKGTYLTDSKKYNSKVSFTFSQTFSHRRRAGAKELFFALPRDAGQE
jgi:hypothetical protein